MDKRVEKTQRGRQKPSLSRRAAAAEANGTRRRRVADKSGEIRIGMRLKHARLVKGMRLHELAERLDCSESFLSKIENNKVRPSLSMLHAITVALDISISQLFDSSDDELSADVRSALWTFHKHMRTVSCNLPDEIRTETTGE